MRNRTSIGWPSFRIHRAIRFKDGRTRDASAGKFQRAHGQPRASPCVSEVMSSNDDIREVTPEPEPPEPRKERPLVGPESEVRGGPEAPAEDGPADRPC